MLNNNTDNKNNKLHLPELIVFSKVGRGKGGSQVLPKDVKNINDLPIRFNVGSIVPSTFKITDERWSVSYVDDGDTYVNVEYSANRSLYVTEDWQGQFKRFSILPSAKEFAFTAQALARFPEPWDNHAKEILEKKYNLQYFPADNNGVQSDHYRYRITSISVF